MKRLLPAFVCLQLCTGGASAQTILRYEFDETGTDAVSSGSSATAVTMRNDAGTATDLHSNNARGVSGLPGDRSFRNTEPSDHGSSASAATNGFRADQGEDASVDGLTSFTISGWFKTENWSTLSGKTPRLVENHDGTNGFNLQFLSGSSGDLKLEVDATGGPDVSSGTSGLFAAKSTWVFFAVRYDGTSSANNVDFYRGFRNDVEAAANGASSAAVQLVAAGSLGCTTCTLDRGPVNSDTAGLVIGNRDELARPFDGYLDDIRVDGGLTELETLESYRAGAISADPLTITYVSTQNVATTAEDQNGNTFTVNEISALSYAADSDRFWGVSDKNGRVIELEVDFAPNGAISSATAVSLLTLSTVSDYEGIAYTNPIRNSVFVSDEASPPQVREFDLTSGSLIQTLSTPAPFLTSSRANLRFESLSRAFDTTEMMTAVQQALTVDGPAGTSTTVPTVVRMLHFLAAGSAYAPAEQYAYVVEPLHATPIDGDGSSLSEVEYLPDGRLMAMERSESEGQTLIRIFGIQLIGATDVRAGALGSGLIGQIYTSVEKKLLYFGFLGKMEAFALGPQLPDGSYAMLAAEDNSGSGPNVLRSFRVSLGGEPPAPTVPSLGVHGGVLLAMTLLASARGLATCRRRGRS